MRRSLAFDLSATSAAKSRTRAQLTRSLCKRLGSISRSVPAARSVPATTLAALPACLPPSHYARPTHSAASGVHVTDTLGKQIGTCGELEKGAEAHTCRFRLIEKVPAVK